MIQTLPEIVLELTQSFAISSSSPVESAIFDYLKKYGILIE